jgi:hypothetical protein
VKINHPNQKVQVEDYVIILRQVGIHQELILKEEFQIVGQLMSKANVLLTFLRKEPLLLEHIRNHI